MPDFVNWKLAASRRQSLGWDGHTGWNWNHLVKPLPFLCEQKLSGEAWKWNWMDNGRPMACLFCGVSVGQGGISCSILD